jgi:hypothetical protein
MCFSHIHMDCTWPRLIINREGIEEFMDMNQNSHITLYVRMLSNILKMNSSCVGYTSDTCN